jgi:hypothetical protein
MVWDQQSGLTVGGVHIPHVTNVRCLKVAKLEILAPTVEIIPQSYLSGPVLGSDWSSEDVWFTLTDHAPYALIPFAQQGWIHDVHLAQPHRPALLGYPVFRYSTLLITFAGCD